MVRNVLVGPHNYVGIATVLELKMWYGVGHLARLLAPSGAAAPATLRTTALAGECQSVASFCGPCGEDSWL